MLAVFTQPDALVVAAVAAAAASSAVGWWNARTAAKATKPNGGSSMRDAIDRIERKLDDHTGRLAVVEAAVARPERARTRKDDT